MDDQQQASDEREVPHCVNCGEEMVETTSGNDQVIEEPGKLEVVIGTQWECENVDCPGKESDLAKATGPDGAQPA